MQTDNQQNKQPPALASLEVASIDLQNISVECEPTTSSPSAVTIIDPPPSTLSSPSPAAETTDARLRRIFAKPTPVKTKDFWHYDNFELNEYERWAATSCRCCYYCCGCCVVPGTLDHCLCCFPVNCCACYYYTKNDNEDQCFTICCYAPCNMICGPTYCMYHCFQVTCCGNPTHRYNRTVNWTKPAENQDFPYFDINRSEVYKIPLTICLCAGYCMCRGFAA